MSNINIHFTRGQILNSIKNRPEWPFISSFEAMYLSAMWQIWDLESSQQSRISQYQKAKLSQLLAFTANNSRWWAKRIPKKLSALNQIPILTREMLREQVKQEGPLPTNPEFKTLKNSTSGSSGQPLSFYVNEYNSLYNNARYLLEHFIQQRDFQKPKTYLRRFDEDFTRNDWGDTAGHIFITGPSRGMDYRTHSVPEIASWLESAPIGYLNISPQYLQSLLMYWEMRGIQCPKATEIITVAGTVYPILRQEVLKKMGARIKDSYTCEEVGPIAFQCPHLDDFLHIASSNVLIETIDQHERQLPQGSIGRLLLTGLNSFSSPIIRYEIGDIGAVLPKCPCGWDGQTLTKLFGRRTSLLKMPDGTLRPFILIGKDWLPIAPVTQYRITQDKPDHLHVEITAEEPLSSEQKQALTDLVKKHSSNSFNITLEQKVSIDWGNNYKKIEVRCLI